MPLGPHDASFRDVAGVSDASLSVMFETPSPPSGDGPRSAIRREHADVVVERDTGIRHQGTVPAAAPRTRKLPDPYAGAPALCRLSSTSAPP